MSRPPGVAGAWQRGKSRIAMNHPQAQGPAPAAPMIIQASTAEASAETIPGLDRPAPAGDAGARPGEPISPGQQESLGVGTEGEVSVWTGHYSYKNFVLRTVVSRAGDDRLADPARLHSPGSRHAGQGGWNWLLWLGGIAVLVYWLTLGWQVLLARQGHHYELTNRRLFVDTGCFRRRRDQVELLRIQDVYVKQQGLLYRLLDIGTVVIETSEDRLPVHYVTGVDDPKGIMDLIWHHARKERDVRSVKVDQV